MHNNLLIEASVSPDITFEMLQVQVICKFKINSINILNDQNAVSQSTDVKYLWFYADSVDDDLLDSLIISKNIVLVGTLSKCKNTIIVENENHFYFMD